MGWEGVWPGNLLLEQHSHTASLQKRQLFSPCRKVIALFGFGVEGSENTNILGHWQELLWKWAVSPQITGLRSTLKAADDTDRV